MEQGEQRADGFVQEVKLIKNGSGACHFPNSDILRLVVIMGCIVRMYTKKTGERYKIHILNVLGFFYFCRKRKDETFVVILFLKNRVKFIFGAFSPMGKVS